MVKRPLSPKKFLTQDERDRIVQAIREAEKKTSGEIRVYLERRSGKDLMKRSRQVFEKLGMTKTRQRNGVLIYFSLGRHRFAILGDQGIHDKVGEGFWKEVVSQMQIYFARGEFARGLEAAIRNIGERLKTYFPREAGDVNELPDQIQG